MAVKLRLRRMGKKKQPVYKVVAADARSPRDGKFIESIGLYNPKIEPALIDIKEERALYWLNVGAQPTDTVRNLLSKKGIMLKSELIKKGMTEDQIVKEMEAWGKLQEVKKSSSVKKQKAAKKKEGQSQQADSEKQDNASEAKGATSEGS